MIGYVPPLDGDEEFVSQVGLSAKYYHPVAGACETCGAEPGTPGWLRNDVSPEHPDFGKVVPCPTCCEAALNRRRLRASQLTGWLLQARLDAFERTPATRAAHDAALEFVKRPDHWLTIHGQFGNGKSHLLAGVVNACLENKIAATYYTLADLLDGLRNGYDSNDYNPLMHRLMHVSVLAIDEMDKARMTEWAAEKLFQLMEARYRGLGTIGTVLAMNTDPRQELEIKDNPKERYLYSRMFDERNTVVEVTGQDVRPFTKRLWQKIKGEA